MNQIKFIILTIVIMTHSIFAQINKNAEKWVQDIDYLIGRLEVQHPNVYANISKNEFLDTAEKLKKRIPDLSDQKVVFGIHELLAKIKDMHTGIAPWQTEDSTALSYYDMYPVFMYQFSDGIFVKGISAKHKKILGCKVLKFGNLAADDTRDKLMNLINGDNYNGRLTLCDLYFSLVGALDYCNVGITDKKLVLTLQNELSEQFEYSIEPMPFMEVLKLIITSRNGKNKKGFLELNDVSNHPLPLYLSKPGDAYWYQYIPEHKTMFVYLKEMQPKSEGDFDRFYKEVLEKFDEKGAEKLVLDVRNNGGGDHFEMPLLKGIIARPNLDKPDKLFVIIGRVTGSASQHFATQFDIYTNATFVGENTGGRPNHYGAQRMFTLPNSKLPVRTSQIYHQDTTEWEMADCTRPDFYIPLSSKNFRNNEDPVLEFIFNFDNVKNLKEQFKTELSEAYTNNGYEGLEKVYYNLIKQYKATGINKGMLINDFLFWLLPNKKSIDDYAKFLTLYTKECPDWTESWYALAQRNEIAGNYTQAEKYYKKALTVFPGNTLAKRMLKLMLFKNANAYLFNNENK